MSNNVIKKTVNDKLVTKFNAIDTNGFIWKIQYINDTLGPKEEFDDADKKISDTAGLVKKQIIMV